MSDELNRREFLANVASVGGSLLFGTRVPEGGEAITVTASPTVFFAQPDGRNALVRFVVDGASAPAGRLRVFDRAQTPVGTAGVIGVGGKLYGELWIPLDRETQLASELELPGVRGVIRTTHRLVPRRHWTIYWLTAADLLTHTPDPEFLDHADFLRLAERKLSDTSTFALDAEGLLDRVVTAPMVLAGSGLNWIGVRNPETPLSRVSSRDGSSVIAVTLAGVGNPNDLGLNSGRNEMTRRVEQWLDGPGSQLTDESHAIAMIVGPEGGDAGNLEERVADWNSRYAFPRLVADRPADLLSTIGKRATTIPAGRRAGASVESSRWQASPLDAQQRALRVFEPVTSRLSAGATGIAALAQQFAFRVPGILVVNAGPFSRTDVAVMPDGTERLVTDVPPLGYVSVPSLSTGEGGRWVQIPGSDNDLTLEGRHFAIRIDLETGAIRSLVAHASGREWARPNGGLNTAAGFRLETLLKLRNEGLGTRIIVGRRSGEGTSLTSTVTVYESMPWADVTNRVGPGARASAPTPGDSSATAQPVTYGFGFALEKTQVSWEVPAGFDERPAPVDRLVQLRWLRLVSGPDTALFRGLDAPVASVGADAEIRSVAPAVQARYRLGFASGFSAPEDPWRFGWGTEPLLSAPVPGTGRATLPSFGSLLLVDQAGACIIELRRVEDDLVFYLQELIGVGRDITVGPGVLSFRGARRIDFAGRDLGALPTLAGGGAAVPIAPFGVTAVRLTGVELAAK